ncbi:MAG: hypothetical protein ACYCZP_08865 [Acidimicrobiales bacterium]
MRGKAPLGLPNRRGGWWKQLVSCSPMRSKGVWAPGATRSRLQFLMSATSTSPSGSCIASSGLLSSFGPEPDTPGVP